MALWLYFHSFYNRAWNMKYSNLIKSDFNDIYPGPPTFAPIEKCCMKAYDSKMKHNISNLHQERFQQSRVGG